MKRKVFLVVMLGVVSWSGGIVVKTLDSNNLAKTTKTSKKVESIAGLEDRNGDEYEAQASYDYPQYYHGGYGGGFHHHHVSHVNDEAVKGLLVPLVGVALLGAAALAASNPLLLQIGVIGGSIGKKRRRRAVLEPGDQQSLETLEAFINQFPHDLVVRQEKKLQARFLQCSGIADIRNQCIERITCEIDNPRANLTQLQRHVVRIITNDILKNEFVPMELKYRLQEATNVGSHKGKCSQFYCKEID